MGILQAPIVLALVSIALFFGAGVQEAQMGGNNNGFIWALLSALVSACVLLLFKGSWSWLVLAQVALFVGIGVFRALRDP